MASQREFWHANRMVFFFLVLKCFPLTQEQPLSHNISLGVIISNHSLVLQGVTRATAGNYSCVGFNAEGEGISAPFALNILCKFALVQLIF